MRLIFIFVLASGLLPAQANPTDRLIEAYQVRVSRYPNDPSTFAKLGAAYFQKARETGDTDYYSRAEKALNKSLELASTDIAASDATLQLALVCMGEHRFSDALELAEKALSLGSGDLTPYAVIGDAYADTGEYEKAAEAYARLEGSDPRSGLSYVHDSRKYFLQFIRGDTAGAIQSIKKAVSEAITNRMPAENIAWTEFELGEMYFQAGDLKEAELAYRSAIETYPYDHRSLAALARTRAVLGSYPEAIDLYQRAIAIVPMPVYAAALGDIFTVLNRPADAKKQFDLVEFIGHLNAINQVLYDRELAVFYADHSLKSKRAVELARKELELRRDVYTWDAFAWALSKNGDAQEASVAIARALQPGVKDSLVLFHAGMIFHQLGQNMKAQEYLDRALAINPKFHITYAGVAARALADLKSGSKTEARPSGS